MGDAVLIRSADPGDLADLVSLLGELFAIEADFCADSEKQGRGLRALLARGKDGHILVAEVDGRVVGMCTVQVVISTAEGGPVGLVEDMVVAHAWRGLGIGPRLLASLEDWARARGLTRLQLLADCENHPALEFYAAQGWVDTQLVARRKLLS